MKFTWQKDDQLEETLQNFLKRQGVSHRMLRTVKQRQGKVLLNHKRKSLTYVLTQPGEVTLILKPEQSDPAVPPSTESLTILYEDSNWLVVDKQAGLNSIPGPANRTDTLVNRVKGHLVEQKAKDLVPHVITRLDRFTSGLALVAKHRFAQGLISQQLENHQLDKRYLALVEGRLEEEHGKIDRPLRQVPNGFAQEVDPAGKRALTEYWVKQRFGTAATLVEVKLHTGRTHQIRAHFSDLGYPLVGDSLYGGHLQWGMERQALHAFQLGFVDPFTQEKREFHSQLPADIQQALLQLEKLQSEKKSK